MNIFSWMKRSYYLNPICFHLRNGLSLSTILIVAAQLQMCDVSSWSTPTVHEEAHFRCNGHSAGCLPQRTHRGRGFPLILENYTSDVLFLAVLVLSIPKPVGQIRITSHNLHNVPYKHLMCSHWCVTQVRAFWPRYWGGMVVVDEQRDFFRALGQGKIPRENYLTGFFLSSTARANFKKANDLGIPWNARGEGNIKGGVYLIRAGSGGVAYQFVERNFGDWAPLDEVLQACANITQVRNQNQSIWSKTLDYFLHSATDMKV